MKKEIMVIFVVLLTASGLGIYISLAESKATNNFLDGIDPGKSHNAVTQRKADPISGKFTTSDGYEVGWAMAKHPWGSNCVLIVK